MPNKNTFEIKPIKSLIDKYSFGKIVDPFANNNKIANITNDLDEQYDTDYHINEMVKEEILEVKKYGKYKNNRKSKHDKHSKKSGKIPQSK